MISYPLLWQSTKNNCKLLITIIALLALYTILIIGMYDPQITTKIEDLLSLLPGEVLKAFGFQMADQSLTGFIASYLFGFLLLIFPMIYEVTTANQLMAVNIERGSMVYLVGSTNSRTKIAYTQAIYLIGSTFVLILSEAVIGTIAAEVMFPGMLKIGVFHDLCIGVFALHFMISGLSFFASCVCKDVKQSLMVGGGIPVFFYLLHMIVNVGDKFSIIKYVTIFTLFDTGLILKSDWLGYCYMVIMALLGIGLYGLGILIFRKRDLSI